MMAEMKVGIIGLGCRGMFCLTDVLCERKDVRVTYVCDEYEDRVLKGVREVKERTGYTPGSTTHYKELIESPDVEIVIVSSAWENHIPACIYAMECGKRVATEVGGAYSVEDCRKLVDTYEKTGIHCMMLENCCYDRNELMVMRMVREGLFGKIVHCEGGYQHDLRGEISMGRENRHYRFRNYLNRCCENYPTHELGPIAKILNINRGNRMVKLTSMASGSWGLNEYARTRDFVNPDERQLAFRQGDIVKTLIECAHGETVCLTLDTTLPRYYSRNFTVRGTKGFFSEVENMVYEDGKCAEFGHGDFNNVEAYRKDWEHPIWRRFLDEGVRGGHGGMDWLVFDAFFTSVLDGTVPPIDTYDTATWMAISPLSEISIQNGSAPVAIPDFTGGKWTCRTDKNTGFYSLDL
ncbi:MAG: Gfo/Idh/MocA family protein [Eubacteriales bacterium]